MRSAWQMKYGIGWKRKGKAKAACTAENSCFPANSLIYTQGGDPLQFRSLSHAAILIRLQEFREDRLIFIPDSTFPQMFVYRSIIGILHVDRISQVIKSLSQDNL